MKSQVHWSEEVDPILVEMGTRSLGFTGTRRGMTLIQRYMVEDLLEGWVGEAHHGDCVGADAQFHAICEAHYYRPKIIVHPPDKNKLRAFCEGDVTLTPLPYLIRNRAIVDACDELWAAPNSLYEKDLGGTWYTVRYAREKGKDITIFYPDGLVYFDCNGRRLKEGDLDVKTGEITPRELTDRIRWSREDIREQFRSHGVML